MPASPDQRRCEDDKGQGDARPPWRKILWEQQPYPDNYVDQTFLASVLTYTDTTQYELLTLIKASAVVTQQLSTVAISRKPSPAPAPDPEPDRNPGPEPDSTPSQVAIFCMLFLLSYYERLSAGALLCLELVLLLLGLAAAVGASRRAGQSSSGGGASTGGGASSAVGASSTGGASSGGGVSQSNARGGARHHGGAGGAGSPLGSPRALRAATGQLLILVCSLLVASSNAWASGLGSLTRSRAHAEAEAGPLPGLLAARPQPARMKDRYKTGASSL